MNRKLTSILGIAFASTLVFQGCQESKKEISSPVVVSIQEVESLKSKNIYSSIALGESTVLMAGENGMLLANIDIGVEGVPNSKQFKNISNSFKIPNFKSYEQIESKRMAKIVDSNETEETPDNPKIYSMLKLQDGILIGGKFATVNGIAKDNLVKLNYDGSINNDFNGSTVGAVYKMIEMNNDIYVAGIFGGYNNNEAYSIVKISSKGAADTTFLPFKDYFLTKINDIETYGSDKLILAGTFIKEITVEDENTTKEELLTMTKSILILDINGNILEEESNKFNILRNETFSIAKDDERLYIAGDFDFIKNTKLYNNLVAFSLDGILDNTFKIDKLNGMIFDVALSDDKIIFGGDFIAEDDNSTNRSFYIVDKNGKTIQVDNLVSDADIYNVDVYNGNIIISGEGEFKVNDKSFANSIMLKISQ